MRRALNYSHKLKTKVLKNLYTKSISQGGNSGPRYPGSLGIRWEYKDTMGIQRIPGSAVSPLQFQLRQLTILLNIRAKRRQNILIHNLR
jgi:hypothetical protein